MTRKRRRLWILLACGWGLASATALTLLAFNDNLVFFLSPSDLASKRRHPVAPSGWAGLSSRAASCERRR